MKALLTILVWTLCCTASDVARAGDPKPATCSAKESAPEKFPSPVPKQLFSQVLGEQEQELKANELMRRFATSRKKLSADRYRPADDFEQWLQPSSGPDSTADGFLEELAIEFQLTRDCPWPERFEAFDTLARFVAEHGHATRACVWRDGNG